MEVNALFRNLRGSDTPVRVLSWIGWLEKERLLDQFVDDSPNIVDG